MFPEDMFPVQESQYALILKGFIPNTSPVPTLRFLGILLPL